MKIMAKAFLALFGLNLIVVGSDEIFHQKAATFVSYHISRGFTAIPGMHDRIVFGVDAIHEGILKIVVGLFFMLLAYCYAGNSENPVSK